MGKTVGENGSDINIAGGAQVCTRPEQTSLTVSLEQIQDISRDSANDLYVVEIDGKKVMVRFDPEQVFNPDGATEEQIIAAYTRAFAEQSRFAPMSSPDHVLELADLASDLRDIRPGTPEYDAIIARMAELSPEIFDKDSLAVSDTDPGTSVRPVQRLSKRLRAKRRAEEMGKRISDLMRKNPNATEEEKARAAFGSVSSAMISDEKLAESREAALALGGSEDDIPEWKISWDVEEYQDEDGESKYRILSTGDFYAPESVQDAWDLFESRVLNGGVRLVVLSGPPSTGKDALVEQMAAYMKMPLVTKNMGPGYDISDALGGEGLGPVTVYDDDGNPQGTVAGSKRIEGSLTEAARYRCGYVMTEIEGMEDDLVRLNTLFGSNVGEPEKRTISAGSITNDEEITPHEDFITFITYNPGHDDVRLPSSVNAPALHLTMEYMEPEAEANIVAKSVDKIMQHQESLPELKGKKTNPEDVMPVVDLVRRLRDAHATDPETWKDQPDMRQAAHIYHDLVQMGRRGQEDPMRILSRSLESLLPGSMEMPVKARQSMINDVLADFEEKLNAIADVGLKIRQEQGQAVSNGEG